MSQYKQQLQKMKTHPGFVAALDQSGGSTPKALRLYGIKEDSWSNEDEMFAIVHQMRTRIITSPSFTGERILAAILFENTMDRDIEGQPSADYLWNVKRVVPFLKVDKRGYPKIVDTPYSQNAMNKQEVCLCHGRMIENSNWKLYGWPQNLESPPKT